jgi:glycosyltransferase involved in cell wall biosynthesis
VDLISIIIPVRNEEVHLEACLKSVLEFKLPLDVKVEILVVDGMSTDRTLEILSKYLDREDNIRVLANEHKYQAHGINQAIKQSQGNWVMRLDAHTLYPNDYLLMCYITAIETQSDNCGGIIITQAGGDNYSAKIVQAITTHKFGVGNSGFRASIKGGVADTVPFGFFQKEIFSKIGYFDERLVRAQDYEFNRRISACGGKIWLNPKIQPTYFNQKYFGSFLKKQLFKEAPYNAYMWYLAPYTFAYRHVITGLFTTGILGGGGLSIIFPNIGLFYCSVIIIYALLAIVSSIQQALRHKNILHVFVLPISFFCYHFIHGLGVIGGILNLISGRSKVQNIAEPWPGYGQKRVNITSDNHD